MLPYFLLALDIIFASGANLLLKKGVMLLNITHSFEKPFYLIFFDLITNSFLMSGLFFYGISFMLWVVILSKLNLHSAYPISVSLTITLITIGSVFIYKEPVSVLQIIGIVVIIFGIGLILLHG